MIISVRYLSLLLSAFLVATSVAAAETNEGLKQHAAVNGRPDCAAMKNMDMSKTDPVVAEALHKKCSTAQSMNPKPASQGDNAYAPPAGSSKRDDQGAH